MSLKWFVQSGTEIFGPWSSSRIRDELRAGSIDPFDLAYIEGSSVKRALIEIDDLFEASGVQPAAIIREEPKANIATQYSAETKENEIPRPFSVSKFEVKPEHFLYSNFNVDQNTLEMPLNGGAKPVSEVASSPSIQGRQKFEELNVAPKVQTVQHSEVIAVEKHKSHHHADVGRTEHRIETSDRPRAFEALASPERVSTPSTTNAVRISNPKDSKNSAPGSVKRYYVIVPGMKMQGPFNSKDLLTLWYAKKLPLNTAVQRIGSQKRIEIQRFVQFYERAQPSGVAFIGEAKLAGASDRSLMWLFLAVFAAVAIIVGALVWKGVRSAKDETILLGSGPLNTAASSNSETPFVTPAQQVTNIAPKISQTTKSLPPTRFSQKAARSTKSRPPKAVGSVKVSESAAQRYKNSSPKQSVNRQNYSNYATRSVNQNKSTPIVPRTAPISSRPSTAAAGVGLIDGAIVSFGGYKFNPSALASCDGKCKIPMTGPRGPVTVVFFKEAFGGSFTGKSASASFTGTVRKDAATGAISILVKSVP